MHLGYCFGNLDFWCHTNLNKDLSPASTTQFGIQQLPIRAEVSTRNFSQWKVFISSHIPLDFILCPWFGKNHDRKIVSFLVVYKSTLSVLLWLADLLQNALFQKFTVFPKICFRLWFIVTNLFYWQIVRTLHSGTNNLCHNDKVPTNVQNVEMSFPANHQSHQNWIKQQIPQKTSIFPICWNSIFICIFICTIPAKKL